MRTTMIGLLAIAASEVFVVSGAESAETQVLPKQSFTISQSLVAGEGTPGSAPVSRTLTFDKFDSSLGTLSGLRINLSSVVDLRAGVRAIPQASANGFGGDSLFNVNLKLNADGIGTLLTYTDSLPVSCTGGISVEGSGCENSVADLRNPFYGSYFTSDAALLANFIRSGASTTFAVNPIADLLLSITACSGANSAGSPIDVTCTGTANLLWEADSDGPNRLPMVGVTYEYIVGVPEPGSMALLGLGLVGLGLARRRRLR